MEIHSHLLFQRSKRLIFLSLWVLLFRLGVIFFLSHSISPFCTACTAINTFRFLFSQFFSSLSSSVHLQSIPLPNSYTSAWYVRCVLDKAPHCNRSNNMYKLQNRPISDSNRFSAFLYGVHHIHGYMSRVFDLNANAFRARREKKTERTLLDVLCVCLYVCTRVNACTAECGDRMSRNIHFIGEVAFFPLSLWFRFFHFIRFSDRWVHVYI